MSTTKVAKRTRTQKDQVVPKLQAEATFPDTEPDTTLPRGERRCAGATGRHGPSATAICPGGHAVEVGVGRRCTSAPKTSAAPRVKPRSHRWRCATLTRLRTVATARSSAAASFGDTSLAPTILLYTTKCLSSMTGYQSARCESHPGLDRASARGIPVATPSAISCDTSRFASGLHGPGSSRANAPTAPRS
jgi:hypothetical protein